MPARVRVLLCPRGHSQDPSGTAVLGTTVELACFGAGASSAERNVRKAASLVFHVAYLDAIRGQEPRFESFATLNGELFFQNDAPRFVIGADSAIEYTSPEPAPSEPPPRQLQLAFAAQQFEVPSGNDALRTLRLPSSAPGARHAEIGVELKIAGAQEASVDVNDRLDVPLAPLSYFDAVLRDENDAALVDREFELCMAGGAIVRGRTDAEGRVRVNPVVRGPCELRLLTETGER